MAKASQGQRQGAGLLAGLLLLLCPFSAQAVTAYKLINISGSNANPVKYWSTPLQACQYLGVINPSYAGHNVTTSPSKYCFYNGSNIMNYGTTTNPPNCPYFATNGECSLTEPAVCNISAGTTIQFNNPNGYESSMVYQSCTFEPCGGSDVILKDNVTGSSLYRLCSTGVVSESVDSSGANPSTPVSENSSTSCSTSSAGNTLCIDALQPNCVTLNGEAICGRTATGITQKFPYDGSCKQINNGAVCEETHINTPTDNYGNSLPADTDIKIVAGTPGTGGNGDGTSDYAFHPDGDGDVAPSAGESTFGSDLGGGGGGCQPGESACPTQINENGTPAGNSSAFSTSLDGTTQGVIDGLGSEDDAPGIGIGPGSSYDYEIPTPGNCATLNFSLLGHSVTIPSADGGCEKMDQMRDILSWVFYVLTLFYLLHLVADTRPR